MHFCLLSHENCGCYGNRNSQNVPTYVMQACDTLKYKMDKSMLILSICMGESIRMKRVIILETFIFKAVVSHCLLASFYNIYNLINDPLMYTSIRYFKQFTF